ncbi:hypothetical protein BDN70DRAFT_940064 [Pholiota conissans]|uniref:Uncharacterized protein n=1 Tax=Pholiota conissans TaxID=109636 RepID=A0A9P5YHQ7_9AGAR|nr:hypothetical protein BDN70DRAFT_940064 [Pholiota conissans]
MRDDGHANGHAMTAAQTWREANEEGDSVLRIASTLPNDRRHPSLGIPIATPSHRVNRRTCLPRPRPAPTPPPHPCHAGLGVHTTHDVTRGQPPTPCPPAISTHHARSPPTGSIPASSLLHQPHPRILASAGI